MGVHKAGPVDYAVATFQNILPVLGDHLTS